MDNKNIMSIKMYIWLLFTMIQVTLSAFIIQDWFIGKGFDYWGIAYMIGVLIGTGMTYGAYREYRKFGVRWQDR